MRISRSLPTVVRPGLRATAAAFAGVAILSVAGHGFVGQARADDYTCARSAGGTADYICSTSDFWDGDATFTHPALACPYSLPPAARQECLAAQH